MSFRTARRRLKIDVNDIEVVANTMQTRIMDLLLDKIDILSMRALVKTYKTQALLELGIENLESVMQRYDTARRQAEKIITLIDQQH